MRKKRLNKRKTDRNRNMAKMRDGKNEEETERSKN